MSAKYEVVFLGEDGLKMSGTADDISEFIKNGLDHVSTKTSMTIERIEDGNE